jgi:predicted subunit of tRNA(5-methylaminomethyl-2-thiouridylate) methyltransferase
VQVESKNSVYNGWADFEWKNRKIITEHKTTYDNIFPFHMQSWCEMKNDTHLFGILGYIAILFYMWKTY